MKTLHRFESHNGFSVIYFDCLYSSGLEEYMDVNKSCDIDILYIK
jgi:hypothetical protein